MSLMWILIGVTILAWLSTTTAAEEAYLVETQLLKTLFTGYDKEVLPLVDFDTPVEVNVLFSLSSILEINEKEGRIAVALYPSMSWVDDRLKWNETFPLNVTAASADKIWKPDLEVWNSLSSTDESGLSLPRAVVTSNGTVYHNYHKVVVTPCEMNLLNFPYDKNVCLIRIGSWVESSKRLKIKLKDSINSLSLYGSHAGWNLEEYKTHTEERSLANGEYFSGITLSIKVARRGSYYYRLFVAPAAVCMFVIPVIHYLPPSSNEKLTLGGLILVAITIMFEMVEDFFPPFSLGNVPIILHYYTALLIILFMSLLLSCMSVVIGTGESKSSRVPRFLRICCIDRLGYICCARGRTSRYDYELLHLEKALRFSAQRQTSRGEDERELTEITDGDDNADEGASNHTSPNNASTTGEGMTEVLKTLINELQYARYKEQIKSEWLQLAMVIDRTGGLVLLLLAVIVTSVINLQNKAS